jgi:DNA-binding SARP family transcriptional activator
VLTVRLLGGFEVKLAGERVDIPSRAAQTLLAQLLLPVGQAHRRGRLAGLLWPDVPETKAQNSLRQALWLLRSALDPSGAGVIVSDRMTVAVDPAFFRRVDVAVLQEPLTPDAPIEELAARVGTYDGELLPGFYDDWVVVERDRLEVLYERLMLELLKRLEAGSRWPQVLEWGERWIGLGHVPEVAFQSVMRAHAALGQAASAIQAFQRCRDALRARLGLEPTEATRALYRQIVDHSGMALPSSEQPDDHAPIELSAESWAAQASRAARIAVQRAAFL